MNLSHWNKFLTSSIQTTSSLLVRISVGCASLLSSSQLADLRNNPTEILNGFRTTFIHVTWPENLINLDTKASEMLDEYYEL